MEKRHIRLVFTVVVLLISLAEGRSGGAKSGGVSSLISADLFNKIFVHRNDNACPARGFYTYDAFVAAANSFPKFGSAGNVTTRRREMAAFLAQISHETGGGSGRGDYAWGLCYKDERNPQSNYCDANNTEWPCVPGKSYHGRGPIQLSWNFNYGPAGEAIGFEGLQNPEVVANDSVVSFKTAVWFWMTPRNPKPSCHDVMVGSYVPSSSDVKAGRLPGFGLVTNIINGGLECGHANDSRVADRIGYYKKYCGSDLFNVDPGPNLDCATQESY